MSKFIIKGGAHLAGEIPVFGSKNAALPLLAACLLTPQKTTLKNIPRISDVENLLITLRDMGADVVQDGDTVVIEAKNIDIGKLPHDIIGKLRGSILLMGALLGRLGKAELPMPGGDVIGARPIDVHLDAFKQLGAKVTRENHHVSIDGSKMKPGVVIMEEFSVTATENAMLAAAALPGKTTIHICATEPHVIALADMLTAMGAKITGAGTHTITVEGKKKLSGTKYTNIPDMLEAGLFILLGAATKSELTVKNVPIGDLQLFLKKLKNIGVSFSVEGMDVRVHPAPLKAFKIHTMPQPGIATDMQAPFSVLATQATGTSLIHDWMYESRFKHCDELSKMGAAVTVCDPHRVVIEGPTPLRGQHIKSLDIRSGATLIMAGLIADGETVIDDAEIIDRGYADLEARLKNIGAHIKRV